MVESDGEDFTSVPGQYKGEGQITTEYVKSAANRDIHDTLPCPPYHIQIRLPIPSFAISVHLCYKPKVLLQGHDTLQGNALSNPQKCFTPGSPSKDGLHLPRGKLLKFNRY